MFYSKNLTGDPPALLKKLGAAAMAGLTIAQITIMSNVAPAQAAYSCQCVEYSKQAAGIPSSVAVGNAKDMIYSLPGQGFIKVNPQVGTLVVMQTSFPGLSASGRIYGHTGIVSAIRQSGGQTYITLRGANQGGTGTDGNCNNVNDLAFGTAVNGRSDITFWGRGNNSTPSGDSSVRSVNFTGTTSSYSTNVRSAPSNTASIVGYINPNTRVSFSGWAYGPAVADVWSGKPDRRYYRIAGTNNWVASAVINGNAPGSTP